MPATNDPFVARYKLPGVPTPLLGEDIANKDYVDSGGGSTTPGNQEASLASVFTTTSTSDVVITGVTLTLPNNSGKSLVIVTSVCRASALGLNAYLSIYHNGVRLVTVRRDNNRDGILTACAVVSNDGNAVDARGRTDGGTATYVQESTGATTKIQTLEFA